MELRKIIFIIGFIFTNIICGIAVNNEAWIDNRDITLQVDSSATFTFYVRGEYNETITIKLTPQHDDILSVSPTIFNITKSNEPLNSSKISEYPICISADKPGHSEVNFTATPPLINTENVFLRVTVEKDEDITEISMIIGWLYFVAWSISFYPQIYMNFKRRSVVGLNFDFLCLNIIGFLLYSVFNCGLYFIPSIKTEYSQRYPRGLNPVQTNDIVFSLHATFATIVTIVQCFLYERENQRVSVTAKSIIGVFFTFIIISAILAITDIIWWLDFLLYCSYVKLCITLIKYVPQAYMNYKRKSTIGWSIGNIFLDFTGGILSILQMVLNAYNYNDWVSILGDPTKFGLGFFSVAFDLFFMFQHYILYRVHYEEIPGEVILQDPADEIIHHDSELPT